MTDVLARPDVVAAPCVDEIFRPAPVDPSKTLTRELLSIGIDMLRATTDELAAAVLERVLSHLAEIADDLAVARLMLSASQTIAYERHVEIQRLRQRNSDLLELARGGAR
jgi:hypothetical protein